MSGYPDDISSSDLCYMEGHVYGDYDRLGNRYKPSSTCERCGEPNYALRAWIGAVTRKARAWGISWLEAESRLQDEGEREAESAAVTEGSS